MNVFTLKTEIRKHEVFNNEIKSFILYTMLERILKGKTKGCRKGRKQISDRICFHHPSNLKNKLILRLNKAAAGDLVCVCHTFSISVFPDTAFLQCLTFMAVPAVLQLHHLALCWKIT